MHSLDTQALVGHDVEGRVLGGRCVLCSPDEAVGAVEDRVTSVGVGRAQREASSVCVRGRRGMKPFAGRTSHCGWGKSLWDPRNLLGVRPEIPRRVGLMVRVRWGLQGKEDPIMGQRGPTGITCPGGC